MNSILMKLSAVAGLVVVMGSMGCTVVQQPPPAAPGQPAAPPPTPTTPPPPPANSGAHPAYLHALSDLRNARANLELKGGTNAMKWDEHDAIADIDRAIGDIKQAAIDDGKDLNDHQPVDAKQPQSGRLHRALDALRAARADIEHEEDNAGAAGLRNRATHDINEAIRRTEDGVKAAENAS